jgi:hypothetical protein
MAGDDRGAERGVVGKRRRTLAPTAGHQDAPATGPVFYHAYEFKVRRAGERDFTNTRAYGVEMYRDAALGLVLFVSDVGSIAMAPASGLPPKANATANAPFVNGMELKARAVGAQGWKDARVYGLEIYREPNSGLIVYILQTGALSVLSVARSIVAFLG